MNNNLTKKNIIVCNTYYQLILALQLNNTLFKDDETTLCLSDHSRNASVVLNNIKDNKIFAKSLYLETLKYQKKDQTFNDRLHSTIKLLSEKDDIWNVLEDTYDEMVFFNYLDSIYTLFVMQYKTNPNIMVSRFDEGLLSYNLTFRQNKKVRLSNFLRKLFHKNIMSDNYSHFYCFYPEIYKGNLDVVKIPGISSNSKTASDLRKIFELDKLDMSYKQKYLFFTSVYDFEGGEPVGEFELVSKARDLVGNDNLLVKKHPRDTRTIYEDNGFNVDKNSAVPWEAIQLANDFSDKVFMTVNSGSVLAGSLMSNHPTRTYYMYKLCDIDGNPSCKKNAEDIEKLLNNESMKDALKEVHIANKVEDIL